VNDTDYGATDGDPMPRVPYHKAFFAHEPYSDDALMRAIQTLSFPNVLAHHEAGHAVMSYALGHGLTELWIQVTRKPEGAWRTRGLSTRPHATTRKMPTPKQMLKPLSDHHQRLLIEDGVMTAAGVAAERKFCLLCDTPMRSLGGSEDDHNAIDGVDKDSTTGRAAIS